MSQGARGNAVAHLNIPERYRSLWSIDYLEGEWKKLPIEIYKQFKTHFRQGGTDDFSTTKWGSSQTLTHIDGKQAWFEDTANVGVNIPAARYTYRGKQIIVVRRQDAYHIVLSTNKRTGNLRPSAQPLQGRDCQVWAPLNERKGFYNTQITAPLVMRVSEKSATRDVNTQGPSSIPSSIAVGWSSFHPGKKSSLFTAPWHET